MSGALNPTKFMIEPKKYSSFEVPFVHDQLTHFCSLFTKFSQFSMHILVHTEGVNPLF